MILIKFKLDSLIFSSGMLAIEHIKMKLKDKNLKVKVIFMDCNMPDLDGF
jgi:CheY-like chemotaxis protein